MVAGHAPAQRRWGSAGKLALGTVAALVALAFVAMPGEASFTTAGVYSFWNSDDGAAWTRPMPTGLVYPFYGATYGDGKYVIVGNAGAIWTSPDGADWTPRTSGATTAFRGVAFGYIGGVPMFAAVGASSGNIQYIYTSPDAITWTPQLVPLTYAQILYGITSGNVGGVPGFVAVGYGGAIVTSTDGLMWQLQASGSASTLYGVAYDGAGRYVSVGTAGALLTSTNGIMWTPATSTTGSTAVLWAVAHGNNQWVAVGAAGTILTSPNGNTWTAQTANTQYQTTLYGVAFGGGRWVAVSNAMYPNQTSYSSYVISSPDGIDWDSRPATTYYYYGPYAVTYGNGQFVAPGYASIIRSLDGLDWIAAHPYATYYAKYGTAYNGTHYVSVGYYGGNIHTSPDGWNWTVRHHGLAAGTLLCSTCIYLYDVGWGAGEWLAVGYAYIGNGYVGIVLASKDGASWSLRATTPAYLYGVNYGPGQWLAVGNSGSIYASPDGQQWTSQASGTTQQLRRVAWGGDRWTAVGASGTMLGSADGSSWSPLASGTTNAINDVHFDARAPGAKWVAAGSGGVIRTSLDGLTWSTVPSSTTAMLMEVTRDDSNWVAVAPNTAVRSATAATGTWTSTVIAGNHYTVAANVVPPLACAPSKQLVEVNKPGRVGGYGGTWPYTWSAPGSNQPGTVMGAAIDLEYATEGTYLVTITDSSSPPQSAQCEVEASKTPPPPVCSPGNQSGPSGTYAFAVAKGTPPFYWTTSPAGTPATAMGTTFTTDLAGGNYVITVTDADGRKATCAVTAVAAACGYTVTTTEDDPGIYDFVDIDPAVGGGGTGLGTPGGWNFYSYYHTMAVTPNPPLEFRFCGDTYKTFWLSGSGGICLDNSGTATATYLGWFPTNCGYGYMATNVPSTNAYMPRPAIFGLYTYYDGNYYGCNGLLYQYSYDQCVFYKVQGSAPNRILIYEFKNIAGQYSSQAVVTWQLKLFEATGCIEGHYKDVATNPSPGYPSVAGYQDASGKAGYSYMYRPGGQSWPTMKDEAWRACPFSANADTIVFNEDQDLMAFNPTENDTTGTAPVWILGNTDAAKGSLLGPFGTAFAYVPFPDAAGPDTFEYSITNGAAVATGKVTLQVNPVNDAPVFDVVGSSVHWSVHGGPYLQPGWARDVAPGPPLAVDEADQKVWFEVASNSNPGLFADGPTAWRTLSAASTQSAASSAGAKFAALGFTPSGMAGNSTVCFVARDNGGTQTWTNMRGDEATGVDTSEPQCIDIKLNAPAVACYTASSMYPQSGQSITFESCSYDTDGQIASCHWDFGDGHTSTQCSPTHTLTAPGEYVVRLTIVDEDGQVSVMEKTIIVGSPEAPEVESLEAGEAIAPVADAGEDRVVPEGALVRLMGSQAGGSSATTFQWTQMAGESVTMAGADTSSPTFTAPTLQDRDEQLLFMLRVTDGALQSAPDYTVVHVTAANHAPIAKAGGTYLVDGGALVQLDGSTSADPDGTPITFQWEQVGGPDVRLSDATSGTPSFVAPMQQGELRFRLTVSDGRLRTVDDALVVVQPAVSAPLTFRVSLVPDAGGALAELGGPEGAVWDLGDGNRAEGATIHHHYAPGTYQVTMRAGSDADAPASTQVLHVEPAILAAEAQEQAADNLALAGAFVLAVAMAGLAAVVARRWR